MKTTLVMIVASASVGLAGCSGEAGGTDSGEVPVDLAAIDALARLDSSHQDPNAAAASEAPKSCAVRADFHSAKVLTAGHWGAWATCADWCPVGSFAYAINMKTLGARGGGSDDSAANAVSLHCFDRTTSAFTEFVESTQGVEGSWDATTTCGHAFNRFNPIRGGNVAVEAKQGSGDDTSVNYINITCNTDTELPVDSKTAWGNLQGLVKCPFNTAVCGIKTRVEPYGGPFTVDDTALNGIEFECCYF